MTRWFASLNLRLALILLLALGASYSLMTWFLHARLADVRISQLASTVAAQVKQAEAELAIGGATRGIGTRIVEGDPPASEHGWRHMPPPDQGNPPPDQADNRGMRPPAPPPQDFDPMLREVALRDIEQHFEAALASELGRPVQVRRGWVRGGGPGVWVRLIGEKPLWLWVATPMKPPARWLDAVLVIPAVGFVLAFVAALFLVVQVNRPLRRLGNALAQVGSKTEPQPLKPEGSSEIRALSEGFNAMLARLKQLEQDRATMLAGIAHDLRTPITRLQLQIELANGPRKEAMLTELTQMNEIFDQFRLFAGGGQAERTEVRDLALLLEELVEPWRAQGLELDLQPELHVEVRPAALRRAIGNLLDNAFAYGAPPVQLRLRSEAGKALIEISDHGPGIPPERIAEALRPFSRLDTARGGSGHSGLGLAIVERLIGEMDGRLELENHAGGGLLARVVLGLAT